LETVRPAIEERQHALRVLLPDQAILVDVDPLRISQAVSNLLTNAAKYTPRGGTITVSVALEAEALTITVADTGAGFDPSIVPTLFDMFSQADSGVEGAGGGLGIGLSLVEGLMRLHGGTVTASSAGKGHGSEFTIRLPRSVVVAQTAPMNSDQASPGTGAEPRARILLADDNRDAADSMAMLLELNGHEVIVAYTGNQALELGRLHAPQVAVLDIGMPDMSGYELARRARKEDWGKDIYLIALTGWGQAEDKDKARAAGFDRHLTKPVDPDRVHELLKTYLESRRV
jgi:CheY-like chemotaxis protein/anti-sigma regulatory factor (Ser/Thr protein kinase)